MSYILSQVGAQRKLSEMARAESVGRSTLSFEILSMGRWNFEGVAFVLSLDLGRQKLKICSSAKLDCTVMLKLLFMFFECAEFGLGNPI